jgi:hypothetical protein
MVTSTRRSRSHHFTLNREEIIRRRASNGARLPSVFLGFGITNFLLLDSAPGYRWIESESRARTGPEPDAAKLIGVAIHVVGADTESSSNLSGINQFSCRQFLSK